MVRGSGLRLFAMDTYTCNEQARACLVGVCRITASVNSAPRSAFSRVPGASTITLTTQRPELGCGSISGVAGVAGVDMVGSWVQYASYDLNQNQCTFHSVSPQES